MKKPTDVRWFGSGDRVGVRTIGDEEIAIIRDGTVERHITWDELRKLMRQLRRARDYMAGLRARRGEEAER